MNGGLISVIIGGYGCGKTNYAVNLALKGSATGKEVALIDLDIVNPYYRSFDFKEMLERKGISLVAPIFAGTNLDLPAVTGEITSVLMNIENVIIDLGGDDAGAIALGGYKNLIQERPYEICYILNPYRTQTQTVKDALEILRDIESAAGIKATSLIGNPNLGESTAVADIYSAIDELLEFSKLSGLPLSAITVEKTLSKKLSLENIPAPIEDIDIFSRGAISANYS